MAQQINPFQTRSKLYRTPFKADSSSSQFDASHNSNAGDSSFLSSSSSSSASSFSPMPTPTSSDLATLPTIPLHQPQEETPIGNYHRKNSQKRSRERTPAKSPEFSLSFSSSSANDSLISDKRFKPNSAASSSVSPRSAKGDADVGVGRFDSVWSLSGLSASLPHVGVDRVASSAMAAVKPSRSSVVSSVGTVIEDESGVDIDTSFSTPRAPLSFSGLRTHIASIESAYKEIYEQNVASEAMIRKYQRRAHIAEDALKAQEQATNEATSIQVMSKQKDKKIARLEFDLEHTRELHRAQRRIVDTQSEEITKLRNRISELKLEIATTPNQHAAKPERPDNSAHTRPRGEKSAAAAQRQSAVVVHSKPSVRPEPKEAKKVDDKPKVVRVALKEKDMNKAQEFANRARHHREQQTKESVEKPLPEPQQPAAPVQEVQARPQEAPKAKEKNEERRSPRILPREIEDLTQQEENHEAADEDGVNWRKLASNGKMNSLKVVQLDKYLRRHGLPKTGKKAVKIERILMHLCSKAQ